MAHSGDESILPSGEIDYPGVHDGSQKDKLEGLVTSLVVTQSRAGHASSRGSTVTTKEEICDPAVGNRDGARSGEQHSGTSAGEQKVLTKAQSSIVALQINLHHSRSASAVLGKRISEGQVDIVLIQEPWTRDGRILGLGCKDNRLFYDRTSSRPRACIYVSPRLNAVHMVSYLSTDNVAVKVAQSGKTGNNDFIISSSYLPYEKQDPLSDEVKALIGYCIRNNKKLILGCDANAHHVVWGSSDCNKRGEDLLEYILRFNLYTLNKGNEPTFVTCNRREVIDVTMCNSSCYEHIRDWKVSDEITLSDHRLISFTITGPHGDVIERRNPRRTDWGSFRQDLDEALLGIECKFNSVYDLDLTVDSLQHAIIQSYYQNCRAAVTSSPRLVPWWSSELSKKRQKARKLFNRAKKTGEWQPYKAALTDYNKAIRDSKRESWRRFCDGVNDIPATARLVKVLARDRNSSLNTIKLPNGQFTESGGETLSEMFRVHFPGSTAADAVIPPSPSVTTECNKERWDVANKIVTSDRVLWAVETFESYKTPGPDGIIPILLQEGKTSLVPMLCRIFRACLAFGFVPTAWRQTKVIFIPKPGKDSYYEAKSFRPISLSSFLLKTLEKLVDRHIREEILGVRPLSPSQHAYQPGKSTSTALYNLSMVLEKNFKAKETALAVFLDIEGAFDKVPVDSILRALSKRDADVVTMDWIKGFLLDRYINATLLGDSKLVKAKAGCPQGGVLSPVLWCLVVDSLIEDIRTMGALCIGYADDVAIVVRGKFVETLSRILTDVLKKVELWCNREGLSVNPDKTTLVAFTRLKTIKLGNVKFYGRKLEYCKEVKYLGIYFDDKMSWKRHQEYCISKAKKIFWSCRNAIGKTWGLNPKMIRWIYSMIVCPIITYGSVCWWSRTKTEGAKADLAKVQRMVCIAMTGALRTTPTAALELLLDMYPLHMSIEAEALLCMYRFSYLGHWNNYSCYLSWKDLNCEIQGHPTFCMRSDGMPMRYVFDKPFKVNFPLRDEWVAPVDTVSAITWYTDGSKMDTGTGSGVCCPMDGTMISSPLGKSSTVFQAEVYAILLCSKACLDRGYKNRCINICSDSQAALLALQKHTISSGIVWDCYNALCNLARVGNQVHLYWVPGHSGIKGNEMADALARKGSATPFIGPEPALGISKDCIRGTVFGILRKQQYQEWLKSKGQRQAKELNSGCPSTRARELFKLNRNGIRRAIGLLTGHCRLKRHMNVMGVDKDPTCRGCRLEDETSSHILCYCEAFSAQRFEHLGRHLLEPWELQDIPVKCLLNFISAVGLL